MPRLTIDLQNGFDKDDVIVRVPNVPQVRRQASTRYQIGLAEHIELDLASGTVEVSVDVPARGLSLTRAIDVDRCPFVAVNIDASGALTISAQTERFRYA